VPSPTRRVALWIEAVSWCFAALGLALPFAFHTEAFSIHREALAHWAYGVPTIPAADRKLLDLMLGILGGSIAGKWIVHALIARGPLAEGRGWARDLTLHGLAAWFVVDSAASLWLGAAFNVWMINLAPLLLVGLPLRGLVPISREDVATPPGRSVWISRLASSPLAPIFYTSLLGAAAGLMIAFGGATPLFAPWWSGLEAAHYGGGALPESSRRLASFFFGPIGGCTLAQFLMLAVLVRRDGATRRTALAGAVSIAAWFMIDSAWGLACGGLFNIALINLPALALTLPPWLLLAHSLAKQPPGQG
jgi:hypothetical protein